MPFGISVEGAAGTALNIGIIIFIVFVVGGLVVAATFSLMKLRRYKQFKCIIFEKDGFGQITESYDEAGIFVDKKTNNKRLYLKRNNVGLSPDNIPFIDKGKTKIVYLFKTGLKNFRYIQINIENPGVLFTVGEEDVNWAINAYERQKKLFQNSLFMQLLPFILVAFVTIIILIIFIYFFKDFAVLKDMANSLKETAMILKGSGTTIVGG